MIFQAVMGEAAVFLNQLRTTMTSNDFTLIALAILGASCTIFGWLARELFAAVQALRRDLSALELKIGTDYVRGDRLHEALVPIMEALKAIQQDLRTKADK